MADKESQKILAALLDEAVPMEHRRQLLMHMMHDGDTGRKAVAALFESAAHSNGETIYNKKAKELSALIDEMQNGPLRSGMFIEMTRSNGEPPRAKVLLQDGECAYTIVPKAELAKTLVRGDMVLLEAQGRALLGRDPSGLPVGDEARLERRLDDGRVEVILDGRETKVFWVTQALAEEFEAGEVDPGAKLLVDTRRRMAVEVIPASAGLSHYQYLDPRPVPDVSVERDIGCPPAYIDELTEHIRTELLDPALGRRYRLRRSRTKLLTGVSGTGKTFSVYGMWHRMYRVMSEVTGVPIDELPPRVLWLRMADIVTKYFGESEQRLNRYFDEVEQLANEEFECPDGRKIRLPVLAVFEEIDALARTRGTGDPITERILTTALDRLDVNNPRLREHLAIHLWSTNVPNMVDPAILRRAGGTTEKFGRLDRQAFMAVLHKQLRDMPFRVDYGPQEEAERRATREVADWLYSRNGCDEGQVTLTYAGSTDRDVRYRRDLLTAALCDRAVQQAATVACHAERAGVDEPGLRSDLLIEALDEQIHSVVDQLTRDNVHHYLDIPDGAHVADVRRLAQPSIFPHELERVG